MRKIAIINQKGGVGKTTTAVNLSRAFSILGKKVLLIDLDPQSNTTLALNINPTNLTETVYTLLKNESKISDSWIVLFDNLWLIPSNLDLAGADLEFANVIGREFILRDTLSNVQGYDFIIIDCPPSLGLLNVNALAFAEEVLIPIQCEFFALQGISLLLKTIEMVKKRLNPGLEIAGVLGCMYDPRTNLSKDVYEEIRKFFKEKVFETKIRKNVSLAEAPSFGKTIFEYAPKSHGAEDYLNLAKEILKIKNTAQDIIPVSPANKLDFLKDIKAITFDLWETLITQTEEQREAGEIYRINEIQKILFNLGYEYSSDTILSAHDNAWNKYELIWRDGKDISSKDNVRIFLQLIEDGLQDEILEKEFNGIMDIYCGTVLIYKPALAECTSALLANLKQRGFKIGLISNTGRNPGSVLRRLLEGYDVLKFFDATAFSNETLVRKPMKKMFDIVLKKLDVLPNHSVHVGDRVKEDILGAKASGMKTIYVSENPEDDVPCDLKVRNIKELFDLFDELYKTNKNFQLKTSAF